MFFVCHLKICISIVFSFPGAILTPKRNWRQCLCKIFGLQTKSIMVFYGIFWSGQYPIASFSISLVLGLCLIILRKFSNMVTLFWNKSSKITITIVISPGVLFFGEYLLSIGICSCVTVQHFMQFLKKLHFCNRWRG